LLRLNSVLDRYLVWSSRSDQILEWSWRSDQTHVVSWKCNFVQIRSQTGVWSKN